MNKYMVQVNQNAPKTIQASKASTAIAYGCRWFKESEFKPSATIIVRYIGKVQKVWDIKADVPNGIGFTRQTVQRDWQSKDAANNEVMRMVIAHPTWQRFKVVSRNI